VRHAKRGCPPWVVLGVKAVEARGALHGEMHSGGTTSPGDAQADVARLSAHPAQITGIAVSSASGWPPWPNRLGGNRMKKLTGSQLFGGANEGAQNQGDK
jgi:hypothetical protein